MRFNFTFIFTSRVNTSACVTSRFVQNVFAFRGSRDSSLTQRPHQSCIRFRHLFFASFIHRYSIAAQKTDCVSLQLNQTWIKAPNRPTPLMASIANFLPHSKTSCRGSISLKLNKPQTKAPNHPLPPKASMANLLPLSKTRYRIGSINVSLSSKSRPKSGT